MPRKYVYKQPKEYISAVHSAARKRVWEDIKADPDRLTELRATMRSHALRRMQDPAKKEAIVKQLVEARRRHAEETRPYTLLPFEPAEHYLLQVQHEGKLLFELPSSSPPTIRMSNFIAQAKFRQRRGQNVDPRAQQLLALLDQQAEVTVKALAA